MQPLCPGCQNPATHSFSGGSEIEPEDLAYQIVRESADGTEGLTISGGEPMHQAVSLYRFLSMIRAIRPNWSLGMFTGYTLTELQTGDYDLKEPLQVISDREWRPLHHARGVLWTHQVKEALDFIITGRYDRSRPPETMRQDLPYRHAVSSANQDIWLLTRRYTYTDFPHLMSEVCIEPDGLTKITGYAL